MHEIRRYRIGGLRAPLGGRAAIYSVLTARAKSHIFKVKSIVGNIPKQPNFVADRPESK